MAPLFARTPWIIHEHSTCTAAVQILVLLLLFVLMRLTVATQQDDNTIELSAFADYLQFNNNLRHAIVALDATAPLTTHYLLALAQLFEHTQLQIFPNNLLSKQKIINYMDLLHIGAHRVAVFVPQMSDALLHETIFESASENGLFNNTYAWFLVANEIEKKEFEQSIDKLFGKYNFHVNADITIARRNEGNTLLLYDLYKLCRHCADTLQLQLKGNWTTRHGLQMQSKFRHSFVRQRMNLRHANVQVGVALINKPDNVTNMQHLLNWETNLQFDVMQRKEFRLLKDVETMYNMSLNVSFSPTFGGFVPAERKWTGIFAQVAYQEVDICGAPVRQTLERFDTFKYTPAFHIEDINTLLRHPRRNNIRNIFFAPLSVAVWRCTLALIILTILLLAIHVRHEYKQHGKPAQPSADNNVNNARTTLNDPLKLLESRFDFFVLVVMEAILMQGPEPNIFNLLSTRILIVTICIFSILLMQFYGAYIVGSLLAEEPRTITTPQALYESNFEIGLENVSYNFDIFEKSLNPYAQRIFYERICSKRNFFTLAEGVERIGRGHFAFQTGVQPMYRSLMRTLTELEYCELQEIFLNRPFVIGTILAKNASFYEFIAQGILKYRTSGLMQYNDILFQVRQPDCSLVRDNVVEVDLEHFIPAVALVVFAMCFAFVVLLLEIVHHRWAMYRQRLLIQLIELQEIAANAVN